MSGIGGGGLDKALHPFRVELDALKKRLTNLEIPSMGPPGPRGPQGIPGVGERGPQGPRGEPGRDASGDGSLPPVEEPLDPVEPTEPVVPEEEEPVGPEDPIDGPEEPEEPIVPVVPEEEEEPIPPPLAGGKEIAFPFPKRGYPMIAFWPGTGQAQLKYMPNGADAFNEKLVRYGFNASPRLPGSTELKYADRMPKLKASVAHTVKIGMKPTTDPNSANFARWRDGQKWAEAFSMFDVPFTVQSGKLVPRNIGTFDVKVPAITSWSEQGGGAAWSGERVTASKKGDTTRSRVLKVNVKPGLYMLTADITVISGAPSCQVYFNVDGGLAVSRIRTTTGELVMPVCVGAWSSRVEIYARIRSSAPGTAAFKNVRLTPMHHALRNVQADMGGVRVRDAAGKNLKRVVSINGSVDYGDPRKGSTCVIRVDARDGTPVLLDYESCSAADKLHMLNHPDAWAEFKRRTLLPTKEMYKDHPPVLAHTNINEIRGYGTDWRDAGYGQSNRRWMYLYTLAHVNAFRAVWPGIYCLVWNDMYVESRNGGRGAQVSFGGRTGGVGKVAEDIATIPGLSVVIWNYNRVVELHEEIPVWLAAGIKPIIGPGEWSENVADWLKKSRKYAEAGDLLGTLYHEYHERIAGIEDFNEYAAVKVK